MNSSATSGGTELKAILIAPDRGLAAQFADTLAESKAFQILADLKKYPSEETLEIRLRQLQPEVVLLDVSSDLETSCGLIRRLASLRPPVPVIGLDTTSRPDTVMRVLKLGAREFLSAPFDPDVQQDAVAGIARQRRPEPAAGSEPGKVIAFSSAQPGSGASTLVCQAAFALRRLTRQRVLVADLDMAGGSVGYYVACQSAHSFLELLEAADQPAFAPVESMAGNCRGVGVLTAPEAPAEMPLDPVRFRQALEQVRRRYDWTLLDLPSIFHPLSLLALASVDKTFLVTTAELPSLHLARRAVRLLAQMGVGQDRLEVVVNQHGRREGMSGQDLEKVLGCPTRVSLPDDHAGIHQATAMGEPVPKGSFADGIQGLVERLAGGTKSEKRRVDFVLQPGPVFAGT
ncbi:MAG: hypothetical protein IT159_05800 [Bryobacterales bacterium]|nr:hypothetical protein [Bryobacterales bacterium]